jgi:predicted nucleotidyltransferase
MRDFEKKALQKISDTIHERFRHEADIYAFGSRVRGDNHMFSDFDLLIVIKDKTPVKEDEIVGIIVDVEIEAECSFSPVIKDSSAFDKERKFNSPFYQNIMNEGIML